MRRIQIVILLLLRKVIRRIVIFLIYCKLIREIVRRMVLVWKKRVWDWRMRYWVEFIVWLNKIVHNFCHRHNAYYLLPYWWTFFRTCLFTEWPSRCFKIMLEFMFLAFQFYMIKSLIDDYDMIFYDMIFSLI
jgi:hypothetical protein